jgi:hypothetical protein
MAMDYYPRDHKPTARQVLAAWVVCFSIIGVTAGLAAMRRDFTATAAADPISATPSADRPVMDGARIPRFVQCCPDPARRSVAAAQPPQGPMSLAIDSCG